MKVRVITALLALPLLFFILYFAPSWCLALAMSLLCMAGVYEILWAAGFAKENRVALVLCFAMAGLLPLLTYFRTFITSTAGILVFVMALFITGFADYSYMTFERICGCFFAAFVIPIFLSGIVRISMVRGGIYFIILPFAIAFGCDTFAYFTGRAFGRHKLCPVISPKKTVEGAVGGLAGGVIATLIVGVVMARFFGATVLYGRLAMFGFIGAIVAQIGDLSLSLIKRNYNIKDYGAIMPGHGGILDRFDSVIFVTPAVEVFLRLAPGVFSWP